ncbi:MAG: hypothetical protein QN122_12050 [Armatimonadota bacterium]|nr:hypothetical protein [Armatimonadota bacterium]
MTWWWYVGWDNVWSLYHTRSAETRAEAIERAAREFASRYRQAEEEGDMPWGGCGHCSPEYVADKLRADGVAHAPFAGRGGGSWTLTAAVGKEDES